MFSPSIAVSLSIIFAKSFSIGIVSGSPFGLSSKNVGKDEMLISAVKGDFEKQWANAIVFLKLAVSAL